MKYGDYWDVLHWIELLLLVTLYSIANTYVFDNILTDILLVYKLHISFNPHRN